MRNGKKRLYLLIVILIGVSFLNSIGSAASFLDNLSLGLERRIGANNYDTIVRQKRVVQLPQSQAAHLQNLFRNLVGSCNRSRELNFTITVLQDDSINAFSLPGGYVFVNSGLLNYVKNDGELAGVLGHEIGHIDRKHGMRALYRTVGFSVLFSLLSGNGQKYNDPEQIRRLAAISMNLAQLGYSRGAEYEADRCGVQLMERAGYDKRDLLRFWSRLETAADRKTPGFMAVLATHPLTRDRIKRIEMLD